MQYICTGNARENNNIKFDKVVKQDPYFQMGANNSTVTIQKNGIIRVIAHIMTTSNDSYQIRLNNTAVLTGHAYSGGNYQTITLNHILQVKVGHVITIYSTSNPSACDGTSTVLQIEMIREC